MADGCRRAAKRLPHAQHTLELAEKALGLVLGVDFRRQTLGPHAFLFRRQKTRRGNGRQCGLAVLLGYVLSGRSRRSRGHFLGKRIRL